MNSNRKQLASVPPMTADEAAASPFAENCPSFTGEPRMRGRRKASTIGSLLLLAVIILHLVDGSAGREWTADELSSLRFPHQTSRDINMDICKAGGFVNDIALTDEQVARFRRLNQTLERLRLSRARLNKSGGDGGGGDEARNARRARRLRNNAKQLSLLSATADEQKAATSGGRGRRAATGRRERVWPHAVIPYEIQNNFSAEHKALFKRAMRHWENHTCLSFVERQPDDEDYIVFTVAECGCCSFVGRRGDGPQAISVGKNCDKFGIIVHELGHVVGFWHEHTRPDRDAYVDIFYKNIQHGQDYNFEKLESSDVDSLGEPYDFSSIMHYARDTFARSMYMDTILPKHDVVSNKRPEIGQRIRLSEGDIQQANLLYKCPVCGKSMMEPSGALVLPEFVSSASSSPLDCQWRLIGTRGERVFLNVTSLQLPKSLSCDSNSPQVLEIRDGHFERSPLIARLCESLSQPRVFMSSGNRMWVGLRALPLSFLNPDVASNKLVQTAPPQFAASYQVKCGGQIEAEEGVLQSPNYPDNYRPLQDCIWFITVPEGYQVALKFELLQLEQHLECIYDHLLIFDGHDDNSTRLSRLCGYDLPENVVASGNKMKVHFHSDNSVDKAGFYLHFVKEFDECKSSNHGCQHRCVNELGGFRCDCEIGFELNADGKTCEDTCGGYIQADNGTLTSPNFPQLYQPNKRCVWEIEANPLFRITLNFTHFDMEGMATSCEYDFVKVSSIRPDGGVVKEHGNHCGTLNKPLVFTSETNKLRVEFTSDGSVQKSGFAAIFSTDRDECAVENGGCERVCKNLVGGFECACDSGFVLAEDARNCKEGGCKHELHEARGLVASPNFPADYDNRQECVWHFVTTPGHRLELTFVEFEVEPHTSCRYDWLKVYDGASQAANELGSLCGLERPEPVLSSTNQLYMVFKSDTSVNRKGFQARYNSICGGTLVAEDSVGYIYSHASYGGSNYGPKMICDWTLLASEGKAVQLRFTNFDLEEESNCDYDFVKIFDGDDDAGNYFGRYCSSKLPSTFISRTNALRLEFHSDDTVERKGFVAEYRLVERPDYPASSTTRSPPPVHRPLEPVINERDNNKRGA